MSSDSSPSPTTSLDLTTSPDHVGHSAMHSASSCRMTTSPDSYERDSLVTLDTATPPSEVSVDENAPENIPFNQLVLESERFRKGFVEERKNLNERRRTAMREREERRLRRNETMARFFNAYRKADRLLPCCRFDGLHGDDDEAEAAAEFADYWRPVVPTRATRSQLIPAPTTKQETPGPTPRGRPYATPTSTRTNTRAGTRARLSRRRRSRARLTARRRLSFSAMEVASSVEAAAAKKIYGSSSDSGIAPTGQVKRLKELRSSSSSPVATDPEGLHQVQEEQTEPLDLSMRSTRQQSEPEEDTTDMRSAADEAIDILATTAIDLDQSVNNDCSTPEKTPIKKRHMHEKTSKAYS